MEQKIIYLYQLGIDSQEQLKFYDSIDLDLSASHSVISNYLGKGFYTRAGRDIWPWKFEYSFWNQIMPETEVPELTSQSLDFASVTDSTADHFRKYKFDRPWYVDWSGGIDSTAILVAIMKRLDRADYENVTVLLNATSVWENPDFFAQHICPNFRCMSTDQFNQVERLLPHYRIHGDPGDMLWGASRGLRAKKDGVDLTRSWKNRDRVWQQFNARMFGTEAAAWIYDRMAENIDSVPQYHIESIADWYWWLNFNFKWVQKMIYDIDVIAEQSAADFFGSIVPWYARPSYQQWSMTNGRFGLVAGGIESYKIKAKDYIFAWDQNVYYRQFKTKFDSSSRNLTSPGIKNVWALTDQMQILDRDSLYQNPELLHQHRNSS